MLEAFKLDPLFKEVLITEDMADIAQLLKELKEKHGVEYVFNFISAICDEIDKGKKSGEW